MAGVSQIDSQTWLLEAFRTSPVHLFCWETLLTLLSSARITESDIKDLQQDPLIERLAPDDCPNPQASQSFFGIAA